MDLPNGTEAAGSELNFRRPDCMRAVVFILLRNAHRLRAHLICSVASAKCASRCPRPPGAVGGLLLGEVTPKPKVP